MSKHRRNNKQSRPHPHPLFSQDGYTNPSAFLGAASPLISSGTFLRSGLTQNPELLTTIYRESWIVKKIIDMPAEDMTRAWYSLAAGVPQEDLDALRRLEARHSLRNEIANALKWARLYGGSLAVIVLRGEENRLDQPLNLDYLTQGCFQGILVVDRLQGITPSLELEDNLDDPDFGLPLYYDINADLGEATILRVHHSRVLRFIGRELPYLEMQRDSFWGASELEHIWEELQKRSSTSANIAQLQETCLRPALKKLLPILEISAFGYYAEDSEIVFVPPRHHYYTLGFQDHSDIGIRKR